MRAVIIITFLFVTSAVKAFDGVQAFGRLPIMKDVQISPDGKKIAYLKENDGRYYAVGQWMDGKKKPAIFGFEESEIRGLTWASNTKILLRVSEPYYSRADFERFTLYRLGIWDIEENDITWAFNSDRFKYNIAAPALVSKILNDDDHVLLSYYYEGLGSGKQLSTLFRVNLNDGDKEEVLQDRNVNFWVADDDGNPVFYRKFDAKLEKSVSMLREPGGENFKPLMTEVEGEKKVFDKAVIGLSAETNKVYYVDDGDGGVDHFFSATIRNGYVDLGVVLGPVGDQSYDVSELVYDYHSSTLTGYAVIEDFEEYRFLSPELAQVYADLKATFSDAEVQITSYTADKNRFVARVSGPANPEQYFLFDRSAGQLQFLGEGYRVEDKAILGHVKPFDFKARDGLELTSYFTLPKSSGEKLPPLIVMPHGGPESRDSKSFDWMRQAFATEGYAVFQPNFRGSSGFGSAFVKKGFGEWGRKMQDDVDDGVAALVAARMVDPERICIVGSSYGGFVALYGAVKRPDIYKCSVSFGGVSELSAMHYHAKEQLRGLDYWKKSIGDQYDYDELAAYSPLDIAGKDSAPMLLFHGDMDTVVPFFQSEKMYKKLKKFRVKGSRLVTLEGEDHWLSKGESRKVFLAESLSFIRKNIQ
ncbi:S9 family peptidase [Microbulbifer magnicolonia]|uniref:alpha/beta hydrolase family protein n=1 Tax=Microbulbifer magnicolonia TaxID=3109744 RepID=UPI002B416C8A|nr:S9 family peptidase [Microbulbifer sp. GG15]